MTPTRGLRWRLTAWYVGGFSLLLLALGAGLFALIARQISTDLDRELLSAVRDVGRGARIEQASGSTAQRALALATDEANGPDHLLYLFDARGGPVFPAQLTDPAIGAAALRTLRRGSDRGSFRSASGQLWRSYGERFEPGGGLRFAIVAVADAQGVEQQYERLIEAFVLVGLLALIPVALGGYYLAGISIAPVERSMEQMRRFTADAAHEMRTPVAVIRGRAEVALEQAREGAGYEAALREIAHEAELLGSIVGDLFTLARADAGQRPVRHEALYLDDLVSDAVSAAGVLARARGVSLEIARFEEAAAFGDPALLRQLVMILLDNAIKFTPAPGAVRVDVFAEGGRAELVVSDEGIGIPADALPHVFERFYRADQARERAGGAGLGLAIAAWIVESHRASISVQSEGGRGTRITVRLPAPPAPSPGRS
jgi:signal transduction histidine kinase